MEPAVRRRTWEERLMRRDERGIWITHMQYQRSRGLEDSKSMEKSPEQADTETPIEENDDWAVGYGYTYIRIWSKHLIKAILRVNKSPPLGVVEVSSINENVPYPTMFDHLEDVRREIEALGNEDALEDLKALDYIIETTVGELWEDAKRLMILEPRQIRYDLLWSLFRAGDNVVWKDDLGNEWLFTLVAVQPERQSGTRGEEEDGEALELITWGLVWDGTMKVLTRKTVTFSIFPFDGLIPIESLLVYPLRYRRGDADQFRSELAKRGMEWWSLITGRTTFRKYNALAYAPEKQGRLRDITKVDERIVLHEEAMAVNSWLPYGSRGTVPSILDIRPEYQWDHLPTTTALVEQQAWFCPPIIGCDGIATRKRFGVSIQKLKPVDWNLQAIQQLVLDKDKKDMLQGLVAQHYLPSRRVRRGDIIAGKGSGLVILLHGPPGVGKTLTAESIAENVKKPLIALSIGDLIHDESSVQDRLKLEFDRAMAWDAILLLDEADVVLEARSFEDLRRNSIVSVFLRTLEYYRGVLFLTTNRIGTMDTAFQSRIQIGIGFKPLTPKIRREIWAKLLTISQESHRISDQAMGEVALQIGHLAAFELNGRQIRNAINVADGYAYHECRLEGKMGYRHIVRAATAAVEFQKEFGDSKSNLKQGQSVWAPYPGSGADTF